MIESLLNIPREAWNVFAEMAPYLLFGFGVAGVLSVFLSPEIVERHLGGRGFWPVLKATLFGIPLPLCSCGVIPVSASLRRHGASRGATTSFLLSTPQTGADSVMVSLALLGPVFAVFRPLVAFITGIIGGSLVEFSDKGDAVSEGTLDSSKDGGGGGEESHGEGFWGRVRAAAKHAFVTLPADIGKALIIGLMIVGVISAFVPDDFFAGVIGTGIGAMVVMMLIGLPVYVCATASVPIVAALIHAGVSPGAAFVFLMTGPATNAATIATIWKLMGRRTAIIYLSTVAVSALLAGWVLDNVIGLTGEGVRHGAHEMLPWYVKTGSAIVLALILAWALFKPTGKKSDEVVCSSGEGTDENAVTLRIDGMTCSHCVRSVEQALSAHEGVESVSVDLKRGLALVSGGNVNAQALVDAINELGYSASTEISEVKP